MSNRSEFPDSYQNRRRNQQEEVNIIWEESDDVYKPIPKNLRDFMAQKGINLQPKESVYRVYINADALSNLKTHLKTNLRVEQGGILFGNAYQDTGLGIYVDITAAVAAPATVGTGAHLDFTPHSWTGIMDYAKAQHPDDNIVGWYHSHPNLSAFMSGTDMNTQQAFFYHPWCLSIVYDPCREDMKFFLGRTAKQIQPKIYGNVGANLQDEKYQEERTDKDQIGWRDSPPRKTRRPKQNSDVIGILILSLIIVIFLFLLANLLGLGNIFNSQQHNSPFEFYIEEMSSKDFQNLRELSDSHPEYLKSSVFKGGDKLGSGGRVKLLVAKPSQKQSIQSVNLKYQEIDLSRKMDIVDARSIFDPHFDTYFQGKNIQDRSIPISVGENADKGFIFFMYSYNSNPNQEDLGKSGESVDSVIYIPNRIEYLTKNTSHLQRIREGLKESGRGYYE
ncbi:MAG: Mov34/MPN/PAD-1 family protein [Microcystis sp. M113S1]|uniref:Mov34/MPN/PAD-1 family protein n=1 Tax=Microcystis sp. M113S1 TaxID=2771104 RepID=UPI00258A11D6|nr:Mov34/MPN/PAD-1 family protein [Microcystis sp. M113S1]MCA2940441.1 Mov34/MPN/PAD-1 family protein [Microcystis sp. M113S1]